MKYTVQVDVTKSGYIVVEANSEDEARRKANEHDFRQDDLSKFWWVQNEVVDVERME